MQMTTTQTQTVTFIFTKRTFKCYQLEMHLKHYFSLIQFHFLSSLLIYCTRRTIFLSIIIYLFILLLLCLAGNDTTKTDFLNAKIRCNSLNIHNCS